MDKNNKRTGKGQNHSRNDPGLLYYEILVNQIRRMQMSFRFRVRAYGHRQVSSKFIKGKICVFALIDGGDDSHLTFWAKIKFAFITNDGLSNIYHTTLLPQQHQVVQKGYKV